MSRFDDKNDDLRTGRKQVIKKNSTADIHHDVAITPLAEEGSKKQPSRYSQRAIVLAVVLLLVFTAQLLVSLFRIQVLNHQEIAAEAEGQYYSKSFIAPARGDIYDRNGSKIAGTAFVYTVGISPAHLYSRSKTVSQAEICAKLAEELQLDLAKVEQALASKNPETNKPAEYVHLANNIPEQNGKALEEFIYAQQVGGVRLDVEPRRYYLNENLASEVVGFVTTGENYLEGLVGVEYKYDAILRGEAGFTYAARDNYLSQGYLPYSNVQEQSGRDGANLVLTLDMNIQRILQADLEAALKNYDAMEDGMAVVMNPYTGEIYAMASYPYFRSDNPWAAPAGKDASTWDGTTDDSIKYLRESVWANKNVNGLYEAGSTMKALTAAIGIEEGVTSEETYYSDDPIQVLDAEISCVSGEGHGHESMEQGFWRSCNPVFVQIALALGTERFYDYMRAFGFYEKTGLDLPGETNCIFHTNPSALDLANLSFGESSSVTPVHLCRAFAALVNGGKLITPHVVKEVVSAEGRLLEALGPRVERQVISADTSARARNLLRGMVEYTKGYTNSWGYSIGGKTSTSTDEITGYNTVSFMAAAPIERPEIICLMILQKPSNVEVGGSEAQIITMNCVSKILDYLNVDRQYTDDDAYKMTKSIEMPDFRGQKLREAAASLTYLQVPLVAGTEDMKGDSVIRNQIPAPGCTVFPGSNVYVFAGDIPERESVLPDFSGMNYNECIYAANIAGVTPQFTGQLTASCVKQNLLDPEAVLGGGEAVPGAKVKFGSLVEIVLAVQP